MKQYIIIIFFITIVSCNKKNSQKDSTVVQKSNEIAKENEHLAKYFERKNIIDSAYFFYNAARDSYTKLNDTDGIGRMHYSIAYLYYNIGDFSRANISALKALSYFKEINVKEHIYKSYSFLGVLYNELNRLDESVKYHDIALSLTENELSKFKTTSLNNLGVTYRNLDKNKQAVEYLEKALQDKNSFKNNPRLHAMLLDNLAYSRLKLKKYKELPQLFYKALQIRDSLQITPGIVINKVHLSEYYQDQKQTVKAIKYAKEAYIIAKEKGIDPKDILRSLKQLRSVDILKKDFYADEYIRISDSLKKSEINLASKLADAEFDRQKLIRQNSKLEKENRNIIVVSIIVILILIIAFLIRLFVLKKREFKLKEERRIANEAVYKMNERIHSLLLSRAELIKEQIRENKNLISHKLQTDLLNKIFEVRMNLQHFNDRTDQLAAVDRSYCIDDLKELELSIMDVCDTLKVQENDSSFVSLLNDLLDNQQGLKVKFDITTKIKWTKVDSSIKVNMYSILSEAIDNIKKHSFAQEIYGGITVEGNDLLLTIVDDGCGFDTDNIVEGKGLKNMRFAAEMMRGVFTINSSKKGTVIKVKTRA